MSYQKNKKAFLTLIANQDYFQIIPKYKAG